MRKLKEWVVLVVCIFLDLQRIRAQDGKSLQYYGFVGCAFNQVLCHADEKCVDDGLFGSCQRSDGNSHDLYRYRLSRNQLVELEQVLHHLATSGYTWRHLYTQCRVMSTLLSYRYDIHLRNDFCERGKQGTGSRSEQSNNDSTEELIDDLIDMLNAKISLTDKEEVSTVGNERSGNWNNGRVSVDYNNAVDQQSEEMFEKILKRLTDDDVKAIKEFLVQQRYNDDYKDGTEKNTNKIQMQSESNANEAVIVKKADPITKVVIHYDPETDASSEGGKQGQFAKSAREDNVSNAETLPSVDKVWTMAPAVGGPGLEDQAVIGSVSTTIEKVDLQGRMNEQASPVGISAFSSVDGFNKTLIESHEMMYHTKEDSGGIMIALYVLCGLLVVLVIAAIAIVVMHHNSHLREKLQMATSDDEHRKDESVITDDLQDLCRENMRKKLEEDKPCPMFSKPSLSVESGKSFQRSNAVSWPEDHTASHMDISTGHMILSYMEDHLRNKDKLDKDWRMLCSYDSESGSVAAAKDPANGRKNRYDDVLPYDQTRVRLNPAANVLSSDYINANAITDADPRCPAYIAAQGPLPNTVSDFWQMIWEQGSTTIVCLTRCTLVENDVGVCFRYWPTDGSDLYHIYEVKLFEEHKQQHDDFIIRNFCLRNTETNETRTVTQFHYLLWPSLGIPASVKTLMDFRRKVNSSYHGRFCPVIVHCSDGAGQTGCYCLIDMVLNRVNKGVREMDIAATLEHIRDQRINMVQTKEQFEFCLTAIAYEVDDILHVTPTR